METSKIPATLQGVLETREGTMGGLPVFRGTRIPVSILLDNVRASISLSAFLDSYPDVTVEQAKAVLDWEDRQAQAGLGLTT
jgi:uncharacterized protein (DUF433 family)